SLLHAVEVTLESVEMGRPECSVRREPGVELAQRSWLDPVDALLRRRTARDETRLPQHLQMFGERGLAHPERLHQRPDAVLAPPEQVEDPAPGRLGEHCERVPRHWPNMLLQAYACQGLYAGRQAGTSERWYGCSAGSIRARNPAYAAAAISADTGFINS